MIAILLLIFTYFKIYFNIEELRELFIDLLPKIIGVFLIIVATKLVLSFLRPAFTGVLKGHKRSQAEIKMEWQLFSNLVWIFIFILLIFIIIGDFTGLLAFGVVVAALLYVLQKPILNIAGWLDIIFHRPYTIGDRVEIDGKKGYVVDVGMFHTTLREFGEWMKGDTFTGRLITVPNSCIFETPILNYTRDTPYIRDEVKIAITYESDHNLAKKLILKSAVEVVGNSMIKHSKQIAQKMDIKDLKSQLIKEPMVRMLFSDSCMNFYVIYFCEASKRREINSMITEKILDRIKSEPKVNIAYPHLEVIGVR
ncbi:MAG: mechanosensitive ion channel [Thermoplasmata archaeon]|nr:MAG: mechanosensitive ion channel [Thermoplasmata archaeon]